MTDHFGPDSLEVLRSRIAALGVQMRRVVQALRCKDESDSEPGVDYQRLLVEGDAPRWLRKLKK